MLRGSKPGERRGGRKRATPNRRTVLTDRILSVGLEHPTASRCMFVLKLVRDQKLPADIRMAVAPKCFPAKRSQSRSRRPRTLAGIQATMQQEALSKAGSPVVSVGDMSLRALEAFFGVVQDVTADPKERRKAALKIAEFLLPKVSKKEKVLPDEYGFKVNPNLASHYRDMQLEVRSLVSTPIRAIPATAGRIKKLQARSDAVLRSLQSPCPTKYGYQEVAQDYLKVIKFIELRDNKVELTEAQSAEEAHRRVRLDVFLTSPEIIARNRRKVLRNAERLHAPPLSHKDRDELELLRWLYAGPKPNASEPDDRHLELVGPHPFLDETPAADGNFYPRDPKPGPAPAADNRSEIQDHAQNDYADDPTDGVNFESWLRGEVKYPVYALRAAAKKRFSRTYPLHDPFKSALIEDLVLKEKLVSENQVCAELARYLPKTAA